MTSASGFHLFGPGHIAMLAAVPSTAALLAFASRRSAGAAVTTRKVLGIVLIGNEAVWWPWRIAHEGFRFPGGLPLQLSDLTLWLIVVALLARSQWAYDVAYFAGLSGSAMAMLTPDLQMPWPSYPAAYFFISHGTVLIGILTLTWGGILRPNLRSLWRALAVLNAFAALIGIFNLVFRENYMYLCRKPGSPSLLDYMGPWPVYLVASEGLAIGLFTLLWLPFRGKNKPA